MPHPMRSMHSQRLLGTRLLTTGQAMAVGEQPSTQPEPAAPASGVSGGRVLQQALMRRLTQELAQEIGDLGMATGCQRREASVSSAGCSALDDLLPAGGYQAGSVIEYLRAAPACGASTLVWAAAAAAQRTSAGYVVVVDTQHNVYPPALLSHGIDLSRVIFVRPQSQADALWSVDQALRTPAVAAVVAELERIDDRSARRLQLAAESGAGLALILRSAARRQQPSWAEVQWLVHSGWLVQLARVRGGRAGQSVCLELNSLTGQLSAVSSSSVRSRNSHVSTAPSRPAALSQGALYLAAQLAHSKVHSGPGQSAGSPHRQLHSGTAACTTRSAAS